MKTILSIDDDPNELAVMTALFTSAGYKHLTADDGLTGINCAVFAKPDLILLDVMMPGADGYEVCRQLRENPRTCNIPVIFKTCLHSNESLLQGIMSGIDDFVVKPCNQQELLQRVGIMLNRSHTQNLNAILSALKDRRKAQ